MGNPAGDWRLQIHEKQMTPGWIVTIWNLADESKWSHEFFGIEEQNPRRRLCFYQEDGRRSVSEVENSRSIPLPVLLLSEYGFRPK